MNKKGAVTLSVNFLVIIILALVILGFSVYFLYDVYSRTQKLSDVTQDDLDRKIETIQCDGLVCVPVNYKEIERGKYDIFGLRIYNDKEGQNFTLKVTAAPGTDPAGKISWMPRERSVFIRTNQETRIAMAFEVQKTADKGIYIFNAMVEDGRGNLYGSPQQVRVEIP